MTVADLLSLGQQLVCCEDSPKTPLKARTEEQICVQSCVGSGIPSTVPVT